MVTVQATGRAFRFLPTERIAQTIWYCFAVCLLGFNIDVHEFCFLSNHFHIVMTPREANLPAFMQKFNSLLSRALNALRGSRGSNIEDHYNITIEVDEEAILRQCAYTLANPCAAHLVSRISQWKGPNSYALEYGQEIIVERPRFGIWQPIPKEPPRKRSRRKHPWDAQRRSFRGRWVLPEKAPFRLVRPPARLGQLNDAQLREEIRQAARVREADADDARKAKGRRALGMRRVLKQRWSDMPNSRQDMFGPEPKVAASSHWARKEAAQRSRNFQKAYRYAWKEWVAGNLEVEFPAGTYFMRCRFGVRCACGPAG